MPVQEHPPPTFEAEISQLTSSLTSWWGSVTKQSQATLDQARSHIQSQGGILNAAKSEWSKLDAHLNDTQKRAREATFSPNDGAGHAVDDTLATPTEDEILEDSADAARRSDKGKGRAPPSPIGDNRSTERRDAQESTQLISADGTIFDSAPPSDNNLDGAHKRNSASIDLNAVAKEAQVQATQFANNATSFFSRIGSQIAADPRVANLQKSLTSGIAGPTNTTASSTEGGAVPDNTSASTTTSRNAPDGATATNNALPSWATTQALARKYLAEAEAVARDVSKDVRELMNEVVQVIPPSEAEARHGSGGVAAGDSAQSEKAQLAAREARSQEVAATHSGTRSEKVAVTGTTKAGEEDFDWDGGEDERPASEASAKGKAATGTTSKPELPAASATTATKSASAQPSSDSGLQTTTGPRTDRFEASQGQAGDDEDGDSDWE